MPDTRLFTSSSLYGRLRNPFKFDHIGDSRTANLTVGGQGGFGNGGSHWFHAANSLLGKRMRLGLNLGLSGFRSDEYLAAGLSSALASDSGWLVFGFPVVNDMAPNNAGSSTTYPYTNLSGTSVTQANVAQVSFNNIKTAALQALAAGKNVIVCEEPGATGFTTAQMTSLLEFNNRLRAFARATPGVYLFSANPIIWNPTGSSTGITFKTGYSTDGTHYTALGAYNVGKAFAAFIGPLLPYADNGQALLADTTANNPYQLIRNPLFNTTTGGTSSNLTLSSGTVPAGWALSASSAGLATVTITNPADPNGFGNGVQMAITTTGACTLAFECNAPANTDWNLTDTLAAGIDASVAAGSSNFAVFFQTQIATNNGTLDLWDMYPITFGNGPTEAYSYRLRSPDSGVKAGATSKTYVAARARMQFTAAGSGTVTWSRPTFDRIITG